ncbi:PIN domain-containing protein [Actinomyces bowdenii]|uniref:PIN domain-containing protein n=1 Tax=Actinomyces bowdenii TaxID=131109 RepID=A0A3P1V6M4_9ACTO|nr:PIN domain-containing protein [Actinomyces bowdenii]
MTQRVLVDANVLFSKTTMDWLFLLRMHNAGMFSLYATEDIIAEVLANMRKKNPTAPGHLTSHRAELIRNTLDEVLRDFPSDIPFTGADPADYHVHAAATNGRADLLLTSNKPEDFTAHPDGEAYSIICPDEFFLLISESNPSCLMPIIEEQMDYWSSKQEHLQLDDALMGAQCPAFSLRVREELQKLAFL